jgi:hypothetical protein
MGTSQPKLGRYRVLTLDGNEYAVVHRDAGDGAPYLPRTLYEALHFTPSYDALPLVENDLEFHPLVGHCMDDPIVG